MQFLCRWAQDNGRGYLENQSGEIVDSSFFCEFNGYTEQDRFMLAKLHKGDRLDLSDGISQFHEVERIS